MLYCVGMVTAFLTALYTFRGYFLTFSRPGAGAARSRASRPRVAAGDHRAADDPGGLRAGGGGLFRIHARLRRFPAADAVAGLSADCQSAAARPRVPHGRGADQHGRWPWSASAWRRFFTWATSGRSRGWPACCVRCTSCRTASCSSIRSTTWCSFGRCGCWPSSAIWSTAGLIDGLVNLVGKIPPACRRRAAVVADRHGAVLCPGDGAGRAGADRHAADVAWRADRGMQRSDGETTFS